MGSDESHFDVSLVVRGSHTTESTMLDEKGEPKHGIEPTSAAQHHVTASARTTWLHTAEALTWSSTVPCVTHGTVLDHVIASATEPKAKHKLDHVTASATTTWPFLNTAKA